MPRKLQPPWGLLGVTIVEPCEFRPEDVTSIEHLLGITEPEYREKLKIELEYFGQSFLKWRRHELLVPPRKEQSAGLEDLLTLVSELSTKSLVLDFAAQDLLYDALTENPYRERCDGIVEYGVEQLDNLRRRLSHIDDSTRKRIKVLKQQTGPSTEHAVRDIIFQLADYYFAVIDTKATHSTLGGIPYSKTDRFIRLFFDAVHNRVTAEERSERVRHSHVKELARARGRKPKKEPNIELAYEPSVPRVPDQKINAALASYVKRHKTTEPNFPEL